jgi:DNA-binding phage protein
MPSRFRNPREVEDMAIRKLKDQSKAADYLTKAFNQGDPVNLQCALLDVIQAQGGYHKVAAMSQMSEWQLKMMLWDDGECWKVLRFMKLLKSMGMDLNLVPTDQKKAKLSPPTNS